MIQYIAEEDWESIRGELESFAYVPAPGTARIPAVIEDDQLLAFCIAEKFLRVDNFWVAPTIRGTAKAAQCIREISSHLFEVVPDGTSAVIVAATPVQEKIFEKLGFREVPGKLYALVK